MTSQSQGGGGSQGFGDDLIGKRVMMAGGRSKIVQKEVTSVMDDLKVHFFI